MKQKISQKHEFAVHVEQLAPLLAKTGNGDAVKLVEEQLFHRLVHVLRLQTGETVTLFDGTVSARITLKQLVPKKTIEGVLISKTSHQPFSNSITVLLPLLKREAFEQALYSCVELGATAVQLITTAKTQRTFSGEKEMQRVQAIMIAAAEQSKQFVFPQVVKPILLEKALQNLPTNGLTIGCSIQGQPFFKTLTQIHESSAQGLALIIGPEADFTNDEMSLLEKHPNTIMTALTPTILRAQQALVVVLGACRAIRF